MKTFITNKFPHYWQPPFSREVLLANLSEHNDEGLVDALWLLLYARLALLNELQLVRERPLYDPGYNRECNVVIWELLIVEQSYEL